MSDHSLLGGGISPMKISVVDVDAKTVCVSGSYEPPGQFVPPRAPASVNVPSDPPLTLTLGGVNSGPSLYRDRILSACALISGVKSAASASDTSCRSYAGGFLGYGCVGEYHSPGTSPFGTGRSSIGHTG